MRFRIVNGNLNDSKIEKQEQKDTQTRQSSGSKFTKQNTFKQMVKNSYEFYLTLGKDKLKQQQTKIAVQKEEKLKKLIKKQRISDERRQKKQLQNKAMNKIQNQDKQKPKRKKSPKPKTEPSRKSQRSRNPISYTVVDKPINDHELFDVLNISSDNVSQQSNQVKLEPLANNEPITNERKQSILQKVQRLKEELIFEDQGTYEIGIAHQALLRVQKFIDQHINFAHEIRQTMYIELGNLVKYVKSHGFVTFDIKKFYLLTRINPYLYKFSDTEHCSTYLMTFKLNGLEIDKRLESTRRRMTQVSTPELFT